MNRRCKVRWAAIAERDLTQIVDYIATDSVENAASVFGKIKKETNSLKNIS